MLPAGLVNFHWHGSNIFAWTVCWESTPHLGPSHACYLAWALWRRCFPAPVSNIPSNPSSDLALWHLLVLLSQPTWYMETFPSNAGKCSLTDLPTYIMRQEGHLGNTRTHKQPPNCTGAAWVCPEAGGANGSRSRV